MKTKLALVIASTLLSVGAANASGNYNVFTFNPGAVDAAAAGLSAFTASEISGQYSETASFTPTSATTGTYTLQLEWSAGQFVTNNGTTPLAAFTTGLGSDYGIYALYNATGSFVTDASGNTTFSFLTGGANFYTSSNPGVSFTSNGSVIPYTVNGAGTSTLIGKAGDDIGGAYSISGIGQLQPGLPTCGVGAGQNCGSFGVNTSFALTNPAGALDFISPVPFYNANFQSGILDDFTPTATQTITGQLGLVFNTIPEPTSLALLGLGMFGMVFGRRNKSV